MVQLKKKAVLLIGALMLLLGMGMNLQYALDDYGLADNNAVIAVWAQQTKTDDYGLAENKAVNQVLAQITGSTETGNPPGEGWTGMYMNCYNQYGNKTGQRYVCYQPGYKSSCVSHDCQ